MPAGVSGGVPALTGDGDEDVVKTPSLWGGDDDKPSEVALVGNG